MNLRSTAASADSSRKLLVAFGFVLNPGALAGAILPLFPWRPSLAGFCCPVLAFVLWLPMTFTAMVAYEDFVINAYFWTLLGILLRLPALPLSSQFANVPAPAAGAGLRAH